MRSPLSRRINWIEGAALITVYAISATAFWRAEQIQLYAGGTLT
jgi:hypothetical protein